MDTCANWTFNYGLDPQDEWDAVYITAITKRMNKVIPGVNFVDNDAHGALYACAYDNAAYGVSPWCAFFTETEIKSFEYVAFFVVYPALADVNCFRRYELDLEMHGAFGYGQPGDMGPLLGSLYVKKLVERFTNATGDSLPAYLEFGHDTTIDQALTGLGLAKQVPLPQLYTLC